MLTFVAKQSKETVLPCFQRLTIMADLLSTVTTAKTVGTLDSNCLRSNVTIYCNVHVLPIIDGEVTVEGKFYVTTCHTRKPTDCHTIHVDKKNKLYLQLFPIVPCVPGTFYDNVTMVCQLCPRGSYQDEAGQSSCKSCNPGTWTAEDGATNATQCQGTEQNWRINLFHLHVLLK